MPATSKKRSSRSRTKSMNRRNNGSAANDAISLLKEDHQRVRQLLRRLESNGTEELLSEVQNELKVHTQIEEEIFYPAFKDAVVSRQHEHLYYEALEEHHVVDLVLPEFKNTSEGSEEFDAKAKVLKDLVEHHAEEEETSMFPKARKAMGTARLRELGEELEQRKHELMGGMRERPSGRNRRRAA